MPVQSENVAVCLRKSEVDRPVDSHVSLFVQLEMFAATRCESAAFKSIRIFLIGFGMCLLVWQVL